VAPKKSKKKKESTAKRGGIIGELGIRRIDVVG